MTMRRTRNKMPLTFPTQAEQALEEFNSATKTISLATIAKRMGAVIEKSWEGTVYTFDDDTALIVKGTGANHKVETLLP